MLLCCALFLWQAQAADDEQKLGIVSDAKDLSPLSDYFDSAVAIALPERREFVASFWESAGLKVDIIDAVTVDEIKPMLANFDGLLEMVLERRDLSVNYRVLTEKAKQMGWRYEDALSGTYWDAGNALFYNNVEIAIFCSHFVAAAKVIDLQSKAGSKKIRVLVSEDDVSVSVEAERGEKLQAQAREALAEVPDDWDALFLGWCHEFCRKLRTVSPFIMKPSHPLCPHAYGLTADGATKLVLEYFEHPKIIDHIIGGMVYSEALRAYSTSPPLIDQGFLGSSWNQAVNDTSGHSMCQEDFLVDGYTAMSVGRFDDAVQVYRGGIAVMPQEAAWHLNAGFAHVAGMLSVAGALNHTNAAVRLATASSGGMREACSQNLRAVIALAKSALQRFYTAYAPAKVAKIGPAFKHYAGKEERLFADLAKKYNGQEVEFSSDDLGEDVGSELSVANFVCTKGRRKYAGCDLQVLTAHSAGFMPNVNTKSEL